MATHDGDNHPAAGPAGPQAMAAAPRLALGLALSLVLALSFLPLSPPEPAGPDAPSSEFSAARAMEHVRALARESHPVGSAENARVRGEIVRRLGALGLAVEVQGEVGVRSDLLRAAPVSNVLARIPGRGATDGGDRTGAVLLVSHYDSTSRGPGAADDAAGVAAMLETARALQQGEPPRHDVILLFTDAEEEGLLGAEAFLARHPWADDVELVLNFEARGTSGPSIMFETGPAPAPLMRRFARAVPHPVASSYSFDVYRRLPNDTDFSLFKRAGLPGFNFAFIHDSQLYHTALDTVDNLSPASLQHHGSYALALARHFSEAVDLGALPQGPPAVYFNLPVAGLVVYSATWALPLAVVLALALLAVLVLGVKRRGLAPLRVLAGAALTLVALAVAAGVVVLLHQLLVRAAGLFPTRIEHMGLYFVAWGLLAASLMLALFLPLGRRHSLVSPVAGALSVWVAGSLCTAAALPSSSYLLLWPAAGAVAALAAWLAWSGTRPWAAAAGLAVGATPALLLWPPTLALLATAFSHSPIGPAAVGLLSALLATALLLPLAVLVGSRRLLVAGGGAVAALVLLGVVVATAGYTELRPMPTSIFYALDADSGEALWATFQRFPTPWSRQFLGETATVRPAQGFFRPGAPPVLAAQAPTLPLPPPRVAVVDARDGTPARMTLRVEPASAGSDVELHLSSPAAITGLTLGGRELDLKQPVTGEPLALRLSGLSAEGFEVAVELDRPAPLTVVAVERAPGLPELPGQTFEPRPATAMPSPFALTDVRLIRKRYDLEFPKTSSSEIPEGNAPGPVDGGTT